MENRYLFRGKRIDNGEWVEGYLSYPFCTKKGNESYYFYAKDSLGFFCRCVVDASTICQCTGLKDKNGKLIWENDILMCHGNSEDLVKAVFGEFNVINAETLEVIDRVIGWHYEVAPTDALSKCEPFCFPMPLTDEYVKTCEMEVVDNPEQVCQKCTLCYETEDDEYLCCAIGKLVPDGEKPD